ncbi:MAG TPA: MBL fold metallo-hydrolase [Candidatus Elarobacter sp.]|nr:MBL fold metallo-hydrolase [Candidatus Elarobacter sp.]
MLNLRFLGTGGARWVVAKQIRSSAGFWLQTGTTNIHVDPGPGALVRALGQVPRCDPATLDAIVLSHKHLDHAGDVNAMIEAMCQGGWKPRGALCAPRDALDPEQEAVVLPYARRFVPREWIVEAFGGPFAVGDVELTASLRLQHPVETYGLHFRTADARVSYVPCTRYFEEIVDDYRARAPDVLVMNVLRYRDSMDVDHLTFDDARRLVNGIRPGVAIMSHFSTRMLERDPKRLAYELEDATGVKTFAAYDGWTYDAA